MESEDFIQLHLLFGTYVTAPNIIESIKVSNLQGSLHIILLHFIL